MVEVMGTLFILSYGETSAFLNALLDRTRFSWCMKMTREDPLLLPICGHCGKYKGVGPCKNPACPRSERQSHNGEPVTEEDVKRPCRICMKDQVLTCAQCGQGFCQKHSVGAELNQLGSFHQRIGTCVECQQVVCEYCWILNPNGDIVCLKHLETE
jgi:hypothetical protein